MSKAGRESSGGAAFDPNQLPVLDAELQYSIAELQGPDLALRDLNLNAALHDRLPRLALTGGGQYKGKPVVLNLQAGAEGEQGQTLPMSSTPGSRRDRPGLPLPAVSASQINLQDVEVRFELASPDATELLRALGIEAPALPPIQAAGNVIRNDQVWQLNDASAQVGESNLAGRLSVDLSRPRPFISADLESDRLRAQDLKVAPPNRRSLPARTEVRRPQTPKPASAYRRLSASSHGGGDQLRRAAESRRRREVPRQQPRGAGGATCSAGVRPEAPGSESR